MRLLHARLAVAFRFAFGAAAAALATTAGCGRIAYEAPAAPPIPATPSSAPAPAAHPGGAPAADSNADPAVSPQSDPVGTPPPRCPNVGPFVKAAAVVKHEPPSRRRPSPAPPSVLDIELTVGILPNPERVTFAPNRLTVAGGVLVEERNGLPPRADEGREPLARRRQGDRRRDRRLLTRTSRTRV